MHHLYRVCCSCLGKTVRVQTRERRIFAGRVVRVTPEHLYLMPVARPVQKTGKDFTAQPALGKTGEGRATSIFFIGPYIIPLAAIIGLTIVGTAPFWGGFGYGPFGYPYGY